MKRTHLPKVLKRLHAELSLTFGEELFAVYLYGSQACGESRPDSDIDILVVLRNDFNYFSAVNKASVVTSALSIEFETVISCVFVTQQDYEQRHTPLLLNIRREGIPV